MIYTEKARKWNEKRHSQKTVKEMCNLAHPVPACLTTKMPSITSLPDASAMSWKNDQGIVILKQLILVDKSLPFIDILNAVVADIFYFLNIYSHGKLPSHCEQRFLPCEIGCVKYSLQDGIMADFHHFIDPGIESHLELLAVENLVLELYRKKYQKEPSKTWVCRELDTVLWDFSSNTSYCISKSLASVYGVSLTAAHLPLQDSEYGESTNTKMVVLDTGRFQVRFFKLVFKPMLHYRVNGLLQIAEVGSEGKPVKILDENPHYYPSAEGLFSLRV
ncbi:hypothetical protein llap_9128 [Limosa lapponica baueri]|uniref:Maelstrom domain-containing protein n=1 Tax=Limosa lapponica baueri TaxID=1758121 RepID=A0A2I0U3M4_LIMLA|nr:hypothetical protein llap_9128 [Limosa lapponica baueri]